MSRRSALIWGVVFLVLALIGSGGAGEVDDLVSGEEDPPADQSGEPDQRRDDREPTRDLGSGRGLHGRVIRIVDGDTVKVLLAPGRTETVRYIGVDTPESVKPNTPVQCFAKQAASFNRRLVEGRRVRLRLGRERRDRYGRLLAYVHTTGEPAVFVNAALLRRGYARTLEVAPNTDRADLFAQLESIARSAGRGLWSACE